MELPSRYWDIGIEDANEFVDGEMMEGWEDDDLPFDCPPIEPEDVGKVIG